MNRKPRYWRLYIIIPSILFVLIAYSSFYISRAAAPARVGGTIICFLVITNFNSQVLTNLPKVDYRVRLLSFLYLSMWFCAFACFEYALVNMLFRIEARVEKAREKAEGECGIKSLDHKRAAKEAIQKNVKSPHLDSVHEAADAVTESFRLRKKSQEAKETRDEEAAEEHKVSVDSQKKILKEVRLAAGRLGRLTLWGGDMWIK